MKLAAALSERASLQVRLFEIQKRLNANAKVQEGDIAAENPIELIAEKDKILDCWFVNDMRQIKSKNLTCFKESVDVVGGRLPIKRPHREIVVFSAVNS